MRGGISQFFQKRRFHGRALRVYGHAKIVACANGVRKKNATASPLASPLEHQGQQRELSGAARRGSATILREAVAKTGMAVFGGSDAPYIWVKTPDGLTSWQMFDRMLHDLNVVITPGAGFGAQGEGYFRVSAFNSRESAQEVARRLERL